MTAPLDWGTINGNRLKQGVGGTTLFYQIAMRIRPGLRADPLARMRRWFLRRLRQEMEVNFLGKIAKKVDQEYFFGPPKNLRDLGPEVRKRGHPFFIDTQ
jgi:hypothetical protein